MLMQLAKNKTLIAASVLIIAGAVCLLLENIFYGYVDDSGILHESFFLPLGVFCLLLGAVMLCLVFFVYILGMIRARHGGD